MKNEFKDTFEIEYGSTMKLMIEDDELFKKWSNRRREILEYSMKMKDEGFDLLKRHFYSLWW